MHSPNPFPSGLTSVELPIHQPGSIQPHGVLVAFTAADLNIVEVSHNTQEYLGIAASALVGQPLTQLLDTPQIASLNAALAELPERGCSLRVTLADRADWEATVHRTGDIALLELERSLTLTDALHLYQQTRQMIATLQQTDSLSNLLNLAVTELRRMSGFDRVMLYQFDDQGAGTVLAEAKVPDLPAYLGLHFPALDVPAEARDMIRRCGVRCCPEVQATPVPLVRDEAVPSLPLDLSLATLCSVSPCAVQYYHNMGAAAFLVIALIKDRQLWGLLSCHHRTPKAIPPELRQACDLLGQFLSLELSQKVDQAELEHMARFKALHSAFIESMGERETLRDALVNPAPRLLELVDAQGAAVCLGNDLTLVGKTPPLADVQTLLAWIETQSSENLFFTDTLPLLYPPALSYKAVASGLLRLQISKVHRYAILWFRPEVIQTVHWGGNPNHGSQGGGNPTVPLSPPASFEQWQEIVQCTALPWKSYELTNALDLRNAIVGIVLKKADELAQINQELERRNRELDSFAFAASHDLREPLRGIYNYATILQEDYEQVLDEEGLDYLKTIVRLAQRMDKLVDVLLRFSQVGQAALDLQDTDLNALVHQTVEVLTAGQPGRKFEVRIPHPLPTIRCDPLLINEVFTNLLGNAFKYNHQTQPWAEVGMLSPAAAHCTGDPAAIAETTPPVFYVRDNGIGIRSQHLTIIFKLFKRLHAQEDYGGGTGAGLTIVQKAVERHGGKIWVESTYGEGSTFYFTLG